MRKNNLYDIIGLFEWMVLEDIHKEEDMEKWAEMHEHFTKGLVIYNELYNPFTGLESEELPEKFEEYFKD